MFWSNFGVGDLARFSLDYGTQAAWLVNHVF
jgi:hypothetical protein